MIWFLVLSVIGVVLFICFKTKGTVQRIAPPEFPQAWKTILERKVLFYHNLPRVEKKRFEKDVSRFLKNVRITGVDTEIDITDKLLVASSATIPVFGFPEWDYTFLDEVLLYPASFDSQFRINSRDEVITGMVGNGSMERKMILSKPALHRGFANESDKQNVGVHEFIHLFDKEDGDIDGIPATLRDKQFALPWLELIRKKTELIKSGKADINPYGATHEREFLAVTGEYFFERPELLQKNHPELYALLAKAFNQHTAEVLKITRLPKTEVERNDPCPCGSGKKFKKCCLATG